MRRSSTDRRGRSTSSKALSINTLAVNDGQETVGYVTKSDRGYFALDANYKLIGIYDSQSKAMRSIPRARP